MEDCKEDTIFVVQKYENPLPLPSGANNDHSLTEHERMQNENPPSPPLALMFTEP